MRRILEISVFGVAIAAGCQSNQEAVFGHNRAVAQRTTAVEAELGSFDGPDWAGRYYTRSNFVGWFVLVSPGSGVVADTWTDLELIAPHGAFGEVAEVTPDRISVRWEPGFEYHGESELLRLRWGERRYLIWPDFLDHFEEEVRREGASQQEFGWAMLHEADEAKSSGSRQELIDAVEKLRATRSR